jgi:hypothetical protein
MTARVALGAVNGAVVVSLIVAVWLLLLALGDSLVVLCDPSTPS